MTIKQPIVWFPTIRLGTGADQFTERLVVALGHQGIKALITWLPSRAEYAPWTVTVPRPPKGVNLVHVNSWLHRRFIPKKIPLVVTIHGCVHDPEFVPYKSLLQNLYHRFWVLSLEKKSIQLANIVTAVSFYTARRSAQVFGRDDIHTIYNWIDTEIFQPIERMIPNRPFRLLFVGNLNQRKGFDLLPQIMSQLGSDFELYYTGTVSDFSRCHNIPNNMIPVGYIDNVLKLVRLYQDADALLFPTRLEGFGLVALEAQACGCPVITTRGSSLPEVVKDSETGVLCLKDDINSFVDAVRKLRNTPEIWRHMRSQGRSHALNIFNEKIAIDQYISFYQHLLLSEILI